MIQQFQRDRFTWLAYLLLAYFAYLQASVGPLMPFVRADMGLNYTVTGFHFSALAVGMILAGLTGDRFVKRTSRQFVLWFGAAGMAIGAVGLTASSQVIFTISSILLMGWLGTFVLIMVQATLSDHHGSHRAIALTESNVIASIGASLAPFFVGRMQGAGVGWEGALYLAVVALIVMAIWFRDEPVPKRATSGSVVQEIASLPAVFWGYALVAFLGVAVEWSTIFWGAEFLEVKAGLTRVNAATVMSVFFAAVILGRFIGARLTRRYPTQRLLLGALGLALIGFPLFWLMPVAALNILGLFITGLGVANLFPFTLAVAVSTASEQADAASARLSLVVGSAILLAPLLLGWLADQQGIQFAYGLVPLLLLIAIAVAIVAEKLAR